MPEYLAPGVYVEEIPSANKPIEGVATSTAGVVGVAARGPVGVPTLVTSFGAFNRVFGGFLDHRVFTGGLDALPYAAQGFFANGGRRLYVTRVVGPDAARSVRDLPAVPAGDTNAPVLAARVAAGAGALTVTAAGEMADGDLLVVADGDRSEMVTVTGAPASSGLRLSAPLARDHAAGAALVAQTVTAGAPVPVTGDMSAGGGLAIDPTGLAADTVLRLEDTEDASRTEFVRIQNAGAADIVEDGLLFDHPQATTTVTQVTLAAADATTLAGAVPAGAVDVTPAAFTGLGPGMVVNVDDELRIVAAELATVNLATATTDAHAPGVAVTRQVAVLRAHARYEGLWGDALRVTARPSSILETTTTAAAPTGAMILTLAKTFGLATGSVLEVVTGAGRERVRVVMVDRGDDTVEIAAALTGDVAQGAEIRSVEFDLEVARIENGRVAESEVFEKLQLDREAPRYAPRVVGSLNRATGEASRSGESELIRLSDLSRNDAGTADVADAAELRLAQPDGRVAWPLADGEDDLTGIDDFTFVGTAAEDPDDRTGIQALENEPAIGICAVPGRATVTVQKALVNHCEKMRYRFAVIETPVGSNLREAQAWRQNFDTTRAAIYYPWLCIADRYGERGDILKIPPSGHVLGIYARTDVERGVWKAPANAVVRGVLAFEVALTKGEQDILNPNHVNCFRDFRSANRALRLWGARTASSAPEWKYVNVRRLFLFIEQSLDNGLQWAVFEPNDERLWASVKQSISNFLITVWRAGGLAGVTEEEAFFVNIGYDVTMTQADLDNGRLIVEVGVAPVRPAEFVIIRISQKVREATA